MGDRAICVILLWMDTNASLVSHSTAVISTLDGVTTVLVAFIFVCLIFPSLVKHRPQYHAALAAIVGILVLHTLTLMFSGSEGFAILMSVLFTAAKLKRDGVQFVSRVLCSPRGHRPLLLPGTG